MKRLLPSSLLQLGSQAPTDKQRRFMKTNRLLTVPIVSLGLYFVLAALSPAIVPGQGRPTFTISFSDGSSVVATSDDLVGLQPNQTVTVAVQLWPPGDTIPDDPPPVDVFIEALDGGYVDTDHVVVGWNGLFSFSFVAGHDPGVSQISLHTDADEISEIGIHFWVLDSENPENNPPVVNSGN